MSLRLTNTSSVAFFGPVPIVSDEVRDLIEIVLSLIIFPFATLGTVTNAINIRVFIQQGVTPDTNTICLFALAIADLLGCLLMIPMTVCTALKFASTDTVYPSCSSFVTIAFNDPHILMSRITCWITVYIAIERCLCVFMPFKVKAILKPRVAAVAMMAIYVIILSSFIPWFLNFGIQWQYSKDYNATVAILTMTAMGEIVFKYLSLTFNTIFSTTAIIITASATGLMLYKLNKYKKWREKSVCASSIGRGPENMNNANSMQPSTTGQAKKNIEMLKTVTMVIGLFVVCLSMSLFPGFAAALVPGFNYVGPNKNLSDLFYSYKYAFDVINSSLNFFFYIRVSSRYKAAYNEIFKQRGTV